ncbi:MAG TPA: hypothetical protein VNM48_07575 [Chloroflexota bacterium]|nr:hypothetical protein [Chloroflexota bacterium]
MGDPKQRVPLAEAEAIAQELVGRLALACSRLEIAGSIRRRRPDVGDIELVAVPRRDAPVITDLFGTRHDGPPVNLLDALCLELLIKNELRDRPDKNGRPAFGERYKRLSYKGVGLDLFSVFEPAQFGVIYTIRTGSAEFSQRLVTPRLMGGWLPVGMSVKDGALWDRGRLIETQEEVEFFRAIGAEFLPPERRTADARPRLMVPA